MDDGRNQPQTGACVMAMPNALKAIIEAMTASGNAFYSRVGTRVYGVHAVDFDNASPGAIVRLIGTETNPHNPAIVARTEIHCTGGRTAGLAKLEDATTTYMALADRLNSIEFFTTTTGAVIHNCVEVAGEQIGIDDDRHEPVSISVWDWVITPAA